MKEEDEKLRQSVESKNRLENLLFTVKGQMADEKAAEKVKPEDKEKIDTIISEGIKWLDEHPREDKEVYDDKFKEVQESLQGLIGAAAGAAGTQETSDNENNMEHDDL